MNDVGKEGERVGGKYRLPASSHLGYLTKSEYLTKYSASSNAFVISIYLMPDMFQALI